MIGKRATVVPAGGWGEKPPRTELVFMRLRGQSTDKAADYALR